MESAIFGYFDNKDLCVVYEVLRIFCLKNGSILQDII